MFLALLIVIIIVVLIFDDLGRETHVGEVPYGIINFITLTDGCLFPQHVQCPATDCQPLAQLCRRLLHWHPPHLRSLSTPHCISTHRKQLGTAFFITPPAKDNLQSSQAGSCVVI